MLEKIKNEFEKYLLKKEMLNFWGEKMNKEEKDINKILIEIEKFLLREKLKNF